MGRRFIPFVIIVCALFAFLPSRHTAAAAAPVVRVVLFFSPTCPHCENVINNTLPPLEQKYPQALAIIKVDVTTPAGGELYQQMAKTYNLPSERMGVPALVIGGEVLVGDQEIPTRLPELIQSGLSNGGIAWPKINGLSSFTQEVEPVNPQIGGKSGPLDRMQERFLRDVAGNTLAVIVLIGMLISIILTAYYFVMGDPEKIKPWPGWVIPVLAVIGMIIAIYLTIVETTKTSAFCGPIGDCNSVQQSPYAMLFGFLPVGVLGLLGYSAILVLWILQAFSSEKLRHLAWLAIWCMAIFGILFSIYLTFLEPFVIGATCIWCISSAIIMTLLLWASTPLARLAASSPEDRTA
jgi:uncharacterized membrane protein